MAHLRLLKDEPEKLPKSPHQKRKIWAKVCLVLAIVLILVNLTILYSLVK